MLGADGRLVSRGRLNKTIALGALLVCGAPASAAGADASGAESAEVGASQVIVRFRDDTRPADRRTARSDAGTDFEQALPLPGLQLVDPEPGVSVGEAVARLERSDDVLYAEPDVTRSAARTPNDPYFSSQWGLRKVGLPAAWNRTTGSSAVTVGVIDGGIDSSHPDLSPNIALNSGESGGGREANGRDDDADGLVDNWRGWDFVERDNDPADPNGHGTHVAGTIGARGNDFKGVAGVAWQVKLAPLRVLGADNTGSVSDVIAAYGYAASKNLPIVNASLAGPTFSQAEYDAIKAAAGTLFVVGAGNDGRDNDVAGSYPCNHPLPNVICVTASDQDDRRPGFASYGRRSVDLAAPGVDIMSTLPGQRWASMSGTSTATPHVAGTAALMRSLYPRSSVAAIRASLLASADPAPSFAGVTLTGGRLNADRALAAAPNEAAYPPEQGIDPARAGTTAPGAPPPAPPSSRDVTPPRLTTSFAPSFRLRTALRRGFPIRARCSEACSLRLKVTVARAGISQVRLAPPTVVVGRAGGRLGMAGSRLVRVRMSARSRRLLRRVQPRRLTLRVRATDPAGNLASVRRPLRLRG